MFDFAGLFKNGIKPHVGAFFVVLLLVVVFASAPFFALWRMAKSVPGVGDVLNKIPGQG